MKEKKMEVPLSIQAEYHKILDRGPLQRVTGSSAGRIIFDGVNFIDAVGVLFLGDVKIASMPRLEVRRNADEVELADPHVLCINVGGGHPRLNTFQKKAGVTSSSQAFSYWLEEFRQKRPSPMNRFLGYPPSEAAWEAFLQRGVFRFQTILAWLEGAQKRTQTQEKGLGSGVLGWDIFESILFGQAELPQKINGLVSVLSSALLHVNDEVFRRQFGL